MARVGGKDRGVYEKTVPCPKCNAAKCATCRGKRPCPSCPCGTCDACKGTGRKGTGIWCVCYFDDHGDKHREVIGSKSAARDLYNQRKNQVREGKKLTQGNRKGMTLRKLVERYDGEFQTNNKPRSYTEVKRHAAYWTEAFGDTPITDITPGDIEAWKAKRLAGKTGSARAREGPAKDATVNRSLAYLKTLLNMAVRDSADTGLTVNPVAQKRVRMRRENNTRDRLLSPAEEAALKPHLTRRKWLAVVIAVQTGMRLTEQFARPRADVDLKRKRICLPDTKGGERQFVPLNAIALEAYRELLASHDSEWAFPGRGGVQPMAMPTVQHWFEKACKAAKLKGVTWHTLRHTFISRLVMLGVPISVVQELARHKSIAMTMRYAHLAPGTKEQALEQLSAGYPSDIGGDRNDTRTDTSENVIKETQ